MREKPTISRQDFADWFSHPMTEYVMAALEMRKDELLMGIARFRPDDQYLDRRLCSVQGVAKTVDEITDYDSLLALIQDVVQLHDGSN